MCTSVAGNTHVYHIDKEGRNLLYNGFRLIKKGLVKYSMLGMTNHPQAHLLLKNQMLSPFMYLSECEQLTRVMSKFKYLPVLAHSISYWEHWMMWMYSMFWTWHVRLSGCVSNVSNLHKICFSFSHSELCGGKILPHGHKTFLFVVLAPMFII